MTDVDSRFPRPVTTSGDRVTRRKSVADRQKSVQQLLIAVAEDTYDGELDVDWDRSPVPGQAWMPERLMSLHGSRMWRKMSPEQRIELSRRELADLLAVAMCLQTAASMLTFRTIVFEQRLVDDRSRFLLSMVNDRSRNVTMFGRLISRTGVDPHIKRRQADRLAHTVLMTPSGPMTQVLMLLADEFVDSLAHEVAVSADMQPHTVQVLKVHTGARNRHIEFAWNELEAALGRTTPRWNRLQGIAAALTIVYTGALLISPEAYREVGLNRFRAVWTAWAGRNYRTRMTALTGDLVAFGIESGLFASPMSRLILRLGRCLPAAGADYVAGGVRKSLDIAV
ncbi:P-aminobenzoate N-oxygenase AurF-like protein [Nocardia nova SH22a]|uniref:p-aminobenzoate N-oxygenase AurF-like protein n=1 Tax=Nocardia nova SH22a TaxID=1415166 RepID=W5TGJ2_9NOCA|nr:diiron oxygenase [Nocardia nova]AHH18460.1 P-aminobenzoate N-oxygenase AurF-like protein [Nocardia nova SH22a]